MAETALDGTVYVSIEHLVRLEHRSRGLSFLPRQSRRSVLAGRHGSRMRGRGLDFEEIRAYVPGDDTRNIDWKVTLRTGRPQVRAYTEERDRPTLLIVDQSMSMFYGTVHAMKSVIAAELAAVAAWTVFAAGDRVGAVVFDDDNLRDIRPHRSRNRIHAVLDAVVAANTRLRADSQVSVNPRQLDRALERALALAAHDHLVCIISDFAGASERTRLLLRELAASNDVIAALVYDPSTLDIKPGAPIVVTGGELQIELDIGERSAVRTTLIEHFQGRQKAVAELLRHSGVPMMAFDTAGDVVEQLRRLLDRSARGRGESHG